jgi:flagellin-like protein
MRKLLKSKKALSPVVAAIILIAVTVAVSIAVAAWMGALTFTFMKTDQFNVVNVQFLGTANTTNNYIVMTVQNIGTSSWTISSAAKVNGGAMTATYYSPSTNMTVPPGGTGYFKIQNVNWINGRQYSMELLTSSGTKIDYVANAPGT